MAPRIVRELRLTGPRANEHRQSSCPSHGEALRGSEYSLRVWCSVMLTAFGLMDFHEESVLQGGICMEASSSRRQCGDFGACVIMRVTGSAEMC